MKQFLKSCLLVMTVNITIGLAFASTQQKALYGNPIKNIEVYKSTYYRSFLNEKEEIFENGAIFEHDSVANLYIKKIGFTNPENTVSFVDLTKGLVAFYPLWGNLNDESGNEHHSAMNGVIPAELGHGILGTAYAFNGENNTFLFAGYEVKQPTMTICTRVKIEDLTRDTIFLCTSNALKLMIRLVDKRYQVEIQYMSYKAILRDENGVFEFDPLNPRLADFLVISYDGSQIKLMIEDQIIDSQNLNCSLLPALPANIKKDINYSFYGILDFIRVYDRVLSEKELEYIRTASYYTIPSLKTDSITNIGKDFATVFSSFKFDHEGKDIYRFGVCWSTSPNPHWSRSPHKFVDYLDSAHTVTYLTGLKPNTIYYLYSYYLSSTGEGFSTETSFVTSPNDSAHLNDGLVAFYPFNGNPNDNSGNYHDGYAEGVTVTLDRYGNSNNAYYFNGQGNSISVNNFNLPSDSITVTCWVKVLSPAISQILISKNSGSIDVELLLKCLNNRYSIEWNIGGSYFSLTDDSSYYLIDPYQPKFDFLVLSYDGQKVNFYINNHLVASRNIIGKIARSSLPLVFGRFAGGTSPENFNGVLDDIRIYNRALNKTEITALFYDSYNQISLPEITTVGINLITITTAWSGGEIKRNGGSEILKSGICWSTSPNPDTSDFKTERFNVAGFASSLTDLQPNTYYFVKAYAINHNGIGYGNQLCFKTLEDSSINLQNGLVAYYPFNSDAKDESGNQFDGIVEGATLDFDRFVSNNSSYEFDTKNATIELPNTVLNDSRYSTISLWVYWYGENPSIILSKQHDYTDSYCVLGIGMGNGGGGLYFGDLERVYFRVKNGSQPIQSNSLLERNKWNHLVVTMGLNIKLYINGILDNQLTDSDFILPDDLNATSTNLGVWLQDGSYDGVFNGKLDDIRIYSREINAAEINALYKEGGKNTNTRLIAYFPFNGNAHDESGNGYHGVVNGATLTTDRFGNKNSAYLFDGTNDHVLVDSAFFNNGWDEYSVSCWVNSFSWNNPISNVENQAIINTIPHNGIELCFNWGKTNRYGVFLNSNPYLSDWDIMHNWVSNTSTSINQWNHLVFVKENNEYRLYINGMLDRSFTSSISPREYLCKIVLGSIEPAVANEYFIGKLDDYRIYNRALSDQEILALYDYQPQPSVYSNELTVKNDSEFDILLNLVCPDELNSIVAFQFDFSYDNQMLQFINYSMVGTLSDNGTIQVNELSGNLVIAWAGQNPLVDSGTLVRLRFKALESGTVTPLIYNFLLNTDTVENITNGTITILPAYGDVDGNDAVQAFDAALALQYSVGLDPLPNIDPLPWENWRIASANVDGENYISAYDASLILQYTVSLIHSFPIQGYLKSMNDQQADVYVNIEDGNLVFRSSGVLKGLNVQIEGNPELFGTPQLTNINSIIAANTSSSKIFIGLAMTNTPPEGEIIMKIPLIAVPDEPVKMNLLINNHEKQMKLDNKTGLAEIYPKPVEIYPNPANSMLYFNNIAGHVSVTIFDMQGRRVITRNIVGNQLDIGNLPEGVYTIHLTDRNSTTIRKLVKN